MLNTIQKPRTLGELKKSGYKPESVRSELRRNMLAALREKRPIFPGIVGFEKTVLPQITNAILAQHDFIAYFNSARA